MRRCRLPLLAFCAALTACSDVAAPEPDRRLPVSAAAVVRSGEAVFSFSGQGFWPCVEEQVSNVVTAPYRYFQVVTPRGDYVYHDLWDVHAVTGTLIGLSSGHVWTRDRNATPYIERSTGGGMTHYTFSGVFVSETGPTLYIHEMFHVSRNAAGEITAQDYNVDCKLLGQN